MPKTEGTNSRKAVLVVMMGLFAVLALLPVILLNNALGEKKSDTSYQELVAYAKAENGDSSYAQKAAAALPSFVRHDAAGDTYTLAKIGEENKCWVITIGTDSVEAPRVGQDADCRP